MFPDIQIYLMAVRTGGIVGFDSISEKQAYRLQIKVELEYEQSV